MLATEYARWQAGRPGLFGDRAACRAAARPSAAPRATINAAAMLLGGPRRAAHARWCCGGESLSYGDAARPRGARRGGLARARRRAGRPRGDQAARRLRLGHRVPRQRSGAGGVAVAVNPRVPAAEWQYILDEAGFSVILAESADDTPSPWRERVMLLDDWRRAVSAGARRRAASRWTPRRRPSGATRRAPRASPRRWCMRSASRGRSSRSRARRSGVRADDRLFASSKLFFAYPQTNSLFAGLKLGATVILDPQWPTRGQRGRQRRDAAPDGAVQRALAVPQPAARGAARRASPRPACACACRPARRCRRACATSGAGRPA